MVLFAAVVGAALGASVDWGCGETEAEESAAGAAVRS